MPETTVDVEALYAALERKRRTEGLSWRDLAQKLGISPSTFTRMAHGRHPDVDTFATLLRWLNMTAEAFMRPVARQTQPPDTVAMISSYLRADKNIRPEEAEALEDIMQAAYRRLTRER